MAISLGDVVEHVVRAFDEDAVALRAGVSARAEEDIAGVVDLSKAHLRLLESHSPSWADASNSSRFPASSITSRGTQSGNGVVQPRILTAAAPRKNPRAARASHRSASSNHQPHEAA